MIKYLSFLYYPPKPASCFKKNRGFLGIFRRKKQKKQKNLRRKPLTPLCFPHNEKNSQKKSKNVLT